MPKKYIERTDHGPISGPYKDCEVSEEMERRARLHPDYGIDYPEVGGGTIDLPGVRRMPGTERRGQRSGDYLGKP